MPDDAQPDQGQGDSGTGGLFDSYLSNVPEDQRETVESYLKDASKQVESRLQEAAEIQKTLGPYQQVESLSAYEPEQLSELLAWHQQVTSSDEAFKQWLRNASQEAELTPDEEQGLQEAEAQGDLSREEVQKLIQQAAEERIAPLQEQFQNLEAEKAIDYEQGEISKELDRLQAEHKVQLSNDQRAVILDLAMPYATNAQGEDLPMGDISWIQKGFDRFKEITTEGQRAFVEQATKQPSAAMQGGGTEKFKPTIDFKEAGEQARERLRQAMT